MGGKGQFTSSEKFALQGLIGRRLKTLRQSRKQTQEQLANAIGAKRSRIAAIEVGNAMPSLETLVSLCRYYGIPAEVFYLPEGSEQEFCVISRVVIQAHNVIDELTRLMKLTDALRNLLRRAQKDEELF